MLTLPPLPFPNLLNRKVKLSNINFPKVSGAVAKFAGQAAYTYVVAIVGGMGAVVNGVIAGAMQMMKGKPLASIGSVVRGCVEAVLGALALAAVLLGKLLELIVLVLNELTV